MARKLHRSTYTGLVPKFVCVFLYNLANLIRINSTVKKQKQYIEYNCIWVNKKPGVCVCKRLYVYSLQFCSVGIKLLIVVTTWQWGVVVSNCMQETPVQSLGQEDPWRRKWQPIQYSCLGNPMDWDP